jgi:hypothetical protein
MEFTQLVWNASALIGIAAVIYMVDRGVIRLFHGEDGPIRVKGGSVTVLNKFEDWVLDEEDGDREYHSTSGSKEWLVKIWKDEGDLGQDPVATFTGRRVIVHCDDGSGGGPD